MDFTQRGSHQSHSAGAAVNGAGGVGGGGHGKKRGGIAWIKLGTVLLLFSATILIIALVMSIATGSPKDESKDINKDELQAVFLNGGQVYFGDITSLNERYLKLNNIYYLRVNQTVQPKQGEQQANNDISLVKLGCELHGPQDEMVINREQVIFWENLKNDGQVAKAVETYVKQNPDGQKCETATTNTNTDTNTNN